MDLFKKLPGFRQTPAGLERTVLRLIPKVFLVGTALIALPSLLSRWWAMDQAPVLVSKFITTIDIYAFSLLSLFWTALFTVGLGALIVMIMKGPAYVADAYPLTDAERPRNKQADASSPDHYDQSPQKSSLEKTKQ